MTTTLVTGASGFVGSRIARLLLESGHRVRVLVRPSSNRGNLRGLDVSEMIGDLRDPASLERALEGCDALFHVGADYRLWTRRPAELYASNVDGTRNIMEAALRTRVRRIVYTSSVATLGTKPHGQAADETTAVTLDDMIGDYKRSKFMAEEVVSQMVRERRLPAVIVNPSTPIGPGDIKPTPTGRLINDAASGKMPAFVDTGLNVVHVDDVAHGHLLAFEKGEIGRRYILGGDDLTLQSILAMIADITGRPPPRYRLPHSVVYPIAWLSECWAHLSNGDEPRATVSGIRMARKHMFFSSQRAERELGYQHRSARQALVDAVRWFVDPDSRDPDSRRGHS
jgi:dihydroflavonol-4-reductase